MFLFDLHQETMLIGLMQGMPNLKLEYIYIFWKSGAREEKEENQQLLVLCKCSLWGTAFERKSRCVSHSAIKVYEKGMEVLLAHSHFYLPY